MTVPSLATTLIDPGKTAVALAAQGPARAFPRETSQPNAEEVPDFEGILEAQEHDGIILSALNTAEDATAALAQSDPDLTEVAEVQTDQVVPLEDTEGSDTFDILMTAFVDTTVKPPPPSQTMQASHDAALVAKTAPAVGRTPADAEPELVKSADVTKVPMPDKAPSQFAQEARVSAGPLARNDMTGSALASPRAALSAVPDDIENRIAVPTNGASDDDATVTNRMAAALGTPKSTMSTAATQTMTMAERDAAQIQAKQVVIDQVATVKARAASPVSDPAPGALPAATQPVDASLQAALQPNEPLRRREARSSAASRLEAAEPVQIRRAARPVAPQAPTGVEFISAAAAKAQLDLNPSALVDKTDPAVDAKPELSAQSGRSTQLPGAFTVGTQRLDLPRHIAFQLHETLRNMPDKPVDISLRPEELGRVRLSISAGEAGVTLSILAERQETLDLMRRHADALTRELADLGFTSIDLSFGQGTPSDAGTDDQNNTEEPSNFMSLDPPESEDDITVTQAQTGLDTTRALDKRI